MRLLISRGAKTDYKRASDGATVVTCAVLGGNLRSLTLLVDELGLPIEPTPPPVNLACGEGHIAVARWLMQRGFPLDEREAEGLNAMSYAALGGSIPTMKWLNRHGLSYAVRNTNQSSLMHVAAAINRPDMIRFLLATGELTAEEKDDKGVTYVHTHCNFQFAQR